MLNNLSATVMSVGCIAFCMVITGLSRGSFSKGANAAMANNLASALLLVGMLAVAALALVDAQPLRASTAFMMVAAGVIGVVTGSTLMGTKGSHAATSGLLIMQCVAGVLLLAVSMFGANPCQFQDYFDSFLETIAPREIRPPQATDGSYAEKYVMDLPTFSFKPPLYVNMAGAPASSAPQASSDIEDQRGVSGPSAASAGAGLAERAKAAGRNLTNRINQAVRT